MKRRTGVFLLIVIICDVLILAQNNNSRRLYEDSCRVVINNLRELQQNDSIAIRLFKDRYDILDMRSVDRDSLFKKSYIEIILYFNSEEGKDCFCRSNVILVEPGRNNVLLLNPSI